jgi:hypothetical protein
MSQEDVEEWAADLEERVGLARAPKIAAALLASEVRPRPAPGGGRKQRPAPGESICHSRRRAAQIDGPALLALSEEDLFKIMDENMGDKITDRGTVGGVGHVGHGPMSPLERLDDGSRVSLKTATVLANPQPCQVGDALKMTIAIKRLSQEGWVRSRALIADCGTVREGPCREFIRHSGIHCGLLSDKLVIGGPRGALRLADL